MAGLGRRLAMGGTLRISCSVSIQLTFMTALRLTSVVDVTLMNTIAPILVGALAIPMFGERPGARFRLWSVLAIVGTGVVVLAGSSGPNGDPLGMTLAALNVVGYSFYFVWSKVARDKIDTVPFLFSTIFVAALDGDRVRHPRRRTVGRDHRA